MAAQVTVSEVQEPALERTPIATRLVALYMFLLFCRILEMLPFLGLGHRHLSCAAPMRNSACDAGVRRCELAPHRIELQYAGKRRNNPGAMSRVSDQQA